MVKDILLILSFFLLFTAIFYYSVPLEIDIDVKILLTVSTFLFGIFSGFLIARQGTRYNAIRDALSKFDGTMSFIYRTSGHFGEEVQKKIGEILKRHYTPILESKIWYYPFTRKTTTLTDIHSLFEKTVGEKNLPSLQNTALSQILRALLESQTLRKNMISLYEERIPRSQWFLLIFLAIIIFVSLLTLPSYFNLSVSIFKGAFGAVLIFVFIFLQKLDMLEFFERRIGENSARDVLEIIEGRK
jgi:hypothetical protein